MCKQFDDRTVIDISDFMQPVEKFKEEVRMEWLTALCHPKY